MSKVEIRKVNISYTYTVTEKDRSLSIRVKQYNNQQEDSEFETFMLARIHFKKRLAELLPYWEEELNRRLANYVEKLPPPGVNGKVYDFKREIHCWSQVLYSEKEKYIEFIYGLKFDMKTTVDYERPDMYVAYHSYSTGPNLTQAFNFYENKILEHCKKWAEKHKKDYEVLMQKMKEQHDRVHCKPCIYKVVICCYAKRPDIYKLKDSV